MCVCIFLFSACITGSVDYTPLLDDSTAAVAGISPVPVTVCVTGRADKGIRRWFKSLEVRVRARKRITNSLTHTHTRTDTDTHTKG